MTPAPSRWEERHPTAVDGKARALTTLAALRRWKVLFLRVSFWLRRNIRPFRQRRARPLNRLSFIHFARWALVKEFAGNEQAPAEGLGATYVYFDSNFNGDFDDYIDAFSYVIPKHMSGIWRGGYGFPGPQPAGAFKEYIHRQESEARYFYSAYPSASATEILAALDVSSRLDGLVRDHAGLSPEAFAESWCRFLRRPPVPTPPRHATVAMTSRDPNRAIDGQAYALTVITGIRPGHEPVLREELESLPARVFAAVPSTHFARFVVIDRLSADAPRGSHKTLRFQYLLFSAVLDGERDAYLRDLCTHIPDTANAIWGHCLGAPRPVEDDREAFGEWMTRNQIHTSAFFAPYGHATVAQVRDSLERHKQVQAFAAKMQYAPARPLLEEFGTEFGGSRAGQPR